MKLFGIKGGHFVRDADRARDARLWAKAADLYIKHLDANPSDVAILVQAGNCLKEARQYKQAAQYYRDALRLQPENADTHLQYGHLMKLMGRQLEALESYKRAVEKDPDNRDALSELAAAGQIEEVFTIPDNRVDTTAKTIWLDITDLIEYAKVNTSLSGIQRVVGNLILHIESGMFRDYCAVPVIPKYDRHKILAASPAAAAALVRQFDTPLSDRDMLDQIITSVLESRFEVQPKQGDLFIVAGAFWIYPHYDVIAKLREKGMRFCVFIHDLIQIRNPEYVQQTAVDQFQCQLIDVLAVSDFVLTNSNYVASETENYFRDHLNFQLPVKAVPLATELRKPQGGTGILTDSIRDMAQKEYVLCVATLEIRKNHMYQVRIWERLVREFGDKTPKLVWVGKWGWQIEELRHYLAEKQCVGDWLFIFNTISDVELEYLYEHALFTCYTSFAEGFGLPIGESLNYGKPCIASNTTSMPEVGGRFVRYIDPFNIEEGYKVFRDVITNRTDLADWEMDIKKNFTPKPWHEFCDELFSTAISMRAALGDGPGALHCRLPLNEIIEGGDESLLRIARQGKRIITFRAARATGWSHMESWGVWCSQRCPILVFDSDLAEGDKIRIYLEVKCPPQSRDIILVAEAGAESASVNIYDREAFISFDGIVGAGGRVTINLTLSNSRLENMGDHSCYLGLTSMAYCQSVDPLARVALLEKVTFRALQKYVRPEARSLSLVG